jgi:hypothetical protein
MVVVVPVFALYLHVRLWDQSHFYNMEESSSKMWSQKVPSSKNSEVLKFTSRILAN